MNARRPEIRWHTRGQGALFDRNDCNQPHRDVPYLSPELLSDDDLADTWR